MSDYRNTRARLENLGLDLVHSPDAVPPGKYTRLKNIFSQRDGEMSTRNGTESLLTVATEPINAIRRIDSTHLIIGAGSSLYNNTTSISSGWSGDALSLVRMRPTNSSDPWMYVADSAKLRRVKGNGTEENWGITEPANGSTLTVTGTGSQDSSVAGAVTYTYKYIYRNDNTGGKSNPSPVSAAVAAASQGIQVGVTASGDAQVTNIWLYRQGGTIVSSYRFVAELGNITTTYFDQASDLSISANDELDIENYVPFPTVDSNGDSVLGTPLPNIWGPFVGKYIFACGDTVRPGYVYWTNAISPESTSFSSNLQVTNPSEPLMNGFIFGSNSYLWSRDNLYTLDFGGPTTIPTFVSRLIPVGIGIVGRNAFTANGPGVVFFCSKDGVYATDCQDQLVSLTDDTLRPIFRGENSGNFLPIDRDEEDAIRMEASQQELHLWYKDTSGARQHLFYDLLRKRWQQYDTSFGEDEIMGYADENQTTQRLLLGGSPGVVYLANSGTTDNGTPIVASVRTGSLDLGVPQTMKEFGNLILDMDPGGNDVTVTPLFNAEGLTGTATVVTGSGRQKVPLTLDDTYAYSLALDFSWSGNGTVLYQFEVLFRLDEEKIDHWEQPENSYGIPGWMHIRDVYFALRSAAEVTVTQTIDGTVYTYTLPSTAGERRRQHLYLTPQKGKMFRWALDSESPFRLYGEDTQFNIKAWNETGYKPVYPFGPVGQATFLRKEAGT